MLKSIGKYVLPMNVAGKSWAIELDVINSSIPLQLIMSKKTMKDMRMIIDLKNPSLILQKLGKRKHLDI